MQNRGGDLGIERLLNHYERSLNKAQARIERACKTLQQRGLRQAAARLFCFCCAALACIEA
jgi:hypothetical protein